MAKVGPGSGRELAHAKPLVLLSNDDGYRAEGVQALARALESWADVVTCAPDVEQSASSHSLSLHRPLRVRRHSEGVYSVEGTPADSVYVGLYAKDLLGKKPDLIVSGMNHGLNLGIDVFYSGTVAAAREGALQGFPALAVSASPDANMAAACREASRIARAIVDSGLRGPRLFNANFPKGTEWAVRATRLGRRVYDTGLVERTDPRGRPYYWIGGSNIHHEPAPGSDTEAYDEGVVGITPLSLDLWSSALEPDAERLVTFLDKASAD